ncbi:hypothetical protein ACWES4_32455 [Streptomyces sp. NPDC004011]
MFEQGVALAEHGFVAAVRLQVQDRRLQVPDPAGGIATSRTPRARAAEARWCRRDANSVPLALSKGQLLLCENLSAILDQLRACR